MISKLEICKDFAQKLRKATLDDVYIIVNEDITPQLMKYVRLLTETPFEEQTYNAYYGEIKKIVNSFLHYYTTVTERVTIDADRLANVVDKDEILSLMDRTINIHAGRQIDFGKDYLPVRSAEEKSIYDEIQIMYISFVQKMHDFKAMLERIDKQEKANDFAQEHYKITVKKTNEILDFTHTYIAMLLADRINEIRISLEEINLRLRNNLRKIKEQSDQAMSVLMNNLYDQNKELIMHSRKDRTDSVELAEITRSIEKTREEINACKYDACQARLVEEVEYWSKRLKDFNEAADLITKLRKEKEYIDQQREIYATRTCPELPGPKANCWARMGASLDEQNEQLRTKIIHAGKCLISFFGIKGDVNVIHDNDLGKYYFDEYNHQVYVEDHHLKMYHLNCKGDFLEAPEGKPYFFDEFGRYVKNDKGEKIHQLAACTSQYTLGEEQLLKKITEDCGHSEALAKGCKMRIKGPDDLEIIPDIAKVDLHRKLDPEVVKYLWDTFGHILPYALHDVCHEKSKNPIHNLAHKLLYYKYNKTYAETEKKKKEAEEFRSNVYKDRQAKIVASLAEWKAKQVQRAKPEASDDADNRVVCNAQMSMAQFFNALAYYY